MFAARAGIAARCAAVRDACDTGPAGGGVAGGGQLNDAGLVHVAAVVQTVLMRSPTLALVAACLASPLLAQGITYQSKDSAGGRPKQTAFVNFTIWFNGYVDFYGMQGNPTFSPIAIPTDGSGDDGARVGADLRQTRFRLGATTNGTPAGPITAYIEADFWGPDGTTVLRLRKAYVTARRFLVGQDWSSFSDISNFPPVADFDGPPTGANVRMAMIQYRSPRDSTHPWSTDISFENPAVDLRYAGVVPDTFIAPTFQRLPNLAAHIRVEKSWGHLQLSGVLLELRYRQDSTNQSKLGYGAALSGVFNVGARDQAYIQALAGRGISRYVTGLGNAEADALVYNGGLYVLPVGGGYVAYQHFWTPSVYSTAVLGGILVQNDIDPAYEDLFRGSYGSINLFVTPAPRLNLGTELVYGWHKDAFGGDGDALRLYLITSYTP
jgi:hypothetical protein